MFQRIRGSTPPPKKNQLHQHAHPQVPKAHLPPHRPVTPWWWSHYWVIRPEAAAANAPCAVACEHPAMRRRSWATRLGTAYPNAKHVTSNNSWGKKTQWQWKANEHGLSYTNRISDMFNTELLWYFPWLVYCIYTPSRKTPACNPKDPFTNNSW